VRGFYSAVAIIVYSLTGPGSAQADLLSDTDTDNVRNLLLLSGVAVASYHRDVSGLRQFGSSVFVTSAITLTTKALVDSRRPNGQDNDSFPSGHVATAFAGAGFLHRRYGLRYGIPAYFAATSVAWSRLENKHHRFVDVAAGGLIALLINQRLVSTGSTLQAQISATNLSIGLRLHF